jgi:hypothetical protein
MFRFFICDVETISLPCSAVFEALAVVVQTPTDPPELQAAPNKIGGNNC